MPEAGESTTDRRQRLTEYLGEVLTADDKNDLIEIINLALSVSPPVGDPAVLEGLARTYRRQVDDIADVQRRVRHVADTGIPDAWVGSTGGLAAEVVMAAADSADAMEQAFEAAAKALMHLADELTAAQSQDKRGREQLRDALGMLGGEDGFFDDLVEKDAEEAERLRARSVAGNGVSNLRSAAETADDAARAAARDLNKLASEARAGQMKTDSISAADKLLLADTSAGDPADDPAEWNELLTANDLERSGRAMERMNARDQAKMEEMLAEAGSPQERAYLMKALAAGHDLKEVEGFRDKIHDKDPDWLRRHLTPVTTAGDSMRDDGRVPSGGYKGANANSDEQWFHDAKWEQEGNTCVPSSVVTGRAMVDPVYALGLTGGRDGKEDDADAFTERLRREQLRLHEEGDGLNEYEFPFGGDTPAGMAPEGGATIANKEISPHTGGEYAYQETGSANARRDVLPDIEKSVAEGRPVPITLDGPDTDEGHAVMIIGQEGDMLQVYNPWGHTTWVSEDDFVHGRMDKAANSTLPDATGVHVPAE
ncbi:peptidoglycan-binding protein [Streptomyces boluensis]|uniref:Peptidoglycan-binding protein n=1 Tax=Streptomyces boluensis TaxID=1775135 RepID=A0A964XPL3_9ACTN|nr:peptidoglycan-binding protein [Streptomyces boluensis]NBE54683.1 peptidoglycan-binding protein [Streptomyces boluensis]